MESAQETHNAMVSYTDSHGRCRSCRRGGRGRASCSRNNNSRPTCKICGKQGHMAVACWHRLDESFQPQHPPNNTSSGQCAAQSKSALFVGPEMVFDSSWYADSGATNHVTSELSTCRSTPSIEARTNLWLEMVNVAYHSHSLYFSKYSLENILLLKMF